MLYRFTRSASIASETHDDTCWTDRASAIAYGRGTHADDCADGGFLYSAEVVDWDRIASWKEAVAAWADAGMATDPDTEPMVYADNPKRRAALKAAGFAGMVYEDAGPENAYQHETVRVWDHSVLSIRDAVRVTSDEIVEAWESLT